MQTETLRPNPTFLAIAKMAVEDHDFKAMALERLAAQYPELDFLFEKYAEMAETIEDHEQSELKQRWEIEDEVDQLKESMSESRDLIKRIVARLRGDPENTYMVTVAELEVAATWLTTK